MWACYFEVQSAVTASRVKIFSGVPAGSRTTRFCLCSYPSPVTLGVSAGHAVTIQIVTARLLNLFLFRVMVTEVTLFPDRRWKLLFPGICPTFHLPLGVVSGEVRDFRDRHNFSFKLNWLPDYAA